MSDVPPSGKPNYGSGVRIAQVIHWLHLHPIGLSVRELADRLGIHERTMSRYINTLKESFIDEDGEPLVEVVRSGRENRLRFRRRNIEMKGSAYELMSLYMALDLMAFLDGTFIHHGAQDVLSQLQQTIFKTQGHQANLIMKDFHKKFFHWTEAPKDYSSHNEILERLVNALIRQKQVRMVYQSPGKPEKVHHLQPLSILMYKRALYLVGRREVDGSQPEKKRDLTFAVERIKDVSVLDTWQPYPDDYDPEKRFQSAFGLIQERDPTEIQLRFDRVVAANVASRRWHQSQELTSLPSGALDMRLKLETSSELVSWILSYGPYVRVISPPSLRQRIRADLAQSLSQYEDENEGPSIKSPYNRE
ncbi:WYL domain-containing transcriptional regulator [Sulfidibacter corallicola]|uniref:WYL domain-containing transcriptional regulator n=1 Tax=Sulfidibacter corallicola TaxID=2818388 RepID=A0A8A4TW81_SULCO|nr:WYL domain-containing transcriptional regulator [Sulfidibacter corallicola]QTD53750.1 WYL domain-containing transcriptional regulator [Sulfidibacter corallicola]